MQGDLLDVQLDSEAGAGRSGGNQDQHKGRHNNEIYAFTKGQASSTTPKGEKRTLPAEGVDLEPLNMPAIAIMHDCTFVARGFARNIDHLKALLVLAVKHPGLSVVDVIQPCITWGTRSVAWYEERIEVLGEDHDPSNKEVAMAQALTSGEVFPIGIPYQTGPRSVFGHTFRSLVTEGHLAELPSMDEKQLKKILSRFT